MQAQSGKLSQEISNSRSASFSLNKSPCKPAIHNPQFSYFAATLNSLIHFAADGRPHIEVSILDKKVTGLLDSGASCTILGQRSEDIIDSLIVQSFNNSSHIQTADGNKHIVKGFIDIPYSYNQKTLVIPTLVVPSITQTLILGVDFWKKFGIQVSVSCIDSPQASELSIEDVEVTTEHLLTPEKLKNLEQVIKKFKTTEKEGLGRTHVLEHFIETGDAKPINQRNYIVSPHLQPKLDDELNRMIALDVIEPSNSPWNNPIVFAPKPNGKIRLCLDSRKLNAVTKRDAYPLPHIHRILGRFRNTKFLSTIDLSDAFWQIPLEQSSKEKTAFSVSSRGHFHFKVMPFGLHNAPQTQSRLMDQILGVDLEPNVFVYLDDIIISSDDLDEHLRLLSTVAERLKMAKLSISLTKSKFCHKSVKYLGYIISEEGIKSDPDKVSSVLNYALPTTAKEVRRFLGMASWYRRFLPNFATITSAISDTLKGKNKFIWTEKANDAFLKLKSMLVAPPVLANPDFSRQFCIQTDASDTGIGAVLTQGELDDERVISYYSQKLSDAQKKYHTTEKECLAVIMAIEKFRPYIEGSSFKVITDHASLLWLNNLKDPTGRLGRWALRLQAYDFVLKHRKGKHNVVPDALSRSLEIAEVSASLKDVWWEKLKEGIEQSPSKFPLFRIDKGKLYKKCEVTDQNEQEWKYVVPSYERQELLERLHDSPMSAHLGMHKTYNRIKQRHYWPNMFDFIKEYVGRCDTCKATKMGKINKCPMGAMKTPSEPWEMIAVDFMGPFTRSKAGNSFIFVVLDVFTKFVLLFPTRNSKAKTVLKLLEEEVFLIFGSPKVLVSDNGSQFDAKAFRKYLKQNGVSHFKNARHHAQNNPAERVNRVAISAVVSYVGQDHRDWDKEIRKIACALRTSVHESTGVTPYKANFGREIYHYAYHTNQPGPSGGKLILNLDDYANGITLRLLRIREFISENLEKAYRRYSHNYNLRVQDQWSITQVT